MTPTRAALHYAELVDGRREGVLTDWAPRRDRRAQSRRGDRPRPRRAQPRQVSPVSPDWRLEV